MKNLTNRLVYYGEPNARILLFAFKMIKDPLERQLYLNEYLQDTKISFAMRQALLTVSDNLNSFSKDCSKTKSSKFLSDSCLL